MPVADEVREAMARAWREGRDHAVRQVEQQIMDGYPKRLPLGEKCPHSVLNGHDCIGCYDEALMTRLTAIRQNEPTSTILDTALSALEAAGLEVRKADAIPPELAALVVHIGRAEWGSTPAHDADGHADHIRESVRITAEHFGQTEPQQMHGLYVEGTETVVCHTGTSPNSPQIARALTGAWNYLHDCCSALLTASNPKEQAP